MALTPAPVRDFGWKAPEFELPGVDGRVYGLQGVAGTRGTLVMFICNHCPFVVGVIERLVTDVEDLMEEGIGAAAICSNDAEQYPEDSFENMRRFSDTHGFEFPYLHDESQDAARAYGAVCTPDFLGFDADLRLQYRGRLDAAGRAPRPDGMVRDLVEAMRGVAAGKGGPAGQTPSMGCSIKWRDGN